MCSIVGSFSRDKVIELCELNRSRGEHSHSISYYIPKEQYLFSIRRSLGPVNYDDIKIPKGMYCIVHQQAPTTGLKGMATVHPADKGSHIIWHNGILKPKEIDRLIKKHEVAGYLPYQKWDTYLLLLDLIKEGYPKDIDGSFSCLYVNEYKKDVFLFRNQIAPMFIDDELNISSTKFDGGEPTIADIMWKLDLVKMTVSEGKHFETMENPYVMEE